MKKTRNVPYLMLLPFIILFAGFFIYPLFYAFDLSLFVTRFGTNTFVGFTNYLNAFRDSFFWDSLGRVVYFGLLQVIAVMFFGLILALFLDSPYIKGKGFFRLVYFLPYAAPGVIAALMWGFLYSPQLDPMLNVTKALFGGHALNLLSSRGLIYGIANIVAWEAAGYNMTLYYSGLTSQPLELYEAAKLDGCNEFQIATKVKIPLLRPLIIFTSVLSIIGSLQLFTEPFILSNLTAVSARYTPNLYTYNTGFTWSNFNYAAALSFVLALVCSIASLAFLYITSREQRKELRMINQSRRKISINHTTGRHGGEVFEQSDW